MAARAIASGTISFGLVSIPIKVYTAAQSKSVRFNMLHETDKARLKQQYLCSGCGDPVERGDTVKGYEYARGQYVVMSDDEIKALEQQSDRSIEIEDFVPIAAVDPVFFEKSNLLGPDKGGQKAYHLLNRAMTGTGRVAVGRFSTRGRHPLVLIRAVDAGLMMHGLYYADEVRSFDDVEFGDAVTLKDGELELANQLIEQLARDRFEPERYEDDYRAKVLAAIDRKVAGEEIVMAPPEKEREQIIDLVAALKKSLDAKGRGDDEAPAKARTRKPAKAKGRKKAATRKTASKG